MGIERRALLADLGALGAAASLTRAKRAAAATPVKLTLPWLPPALAHDGPPSLARSRRRPPGVGQPLLFLIIAGKGGKLVRRVVLADRHRANAREVNIGQARLLGPGVELRLHLGEVAL